MTVDFRPYVLRKLYLAVLKKNKHTFVYDFFGQSVYCFRIYCQNICSVIEIKQSLTKTTCTIFGHQKVTHMKYQRALIYAILCDVTLCTVLVPLSASVVTTEDINENNLSVCLSHYYSMGWDNFPWPTYRA